jgi:hypothetical protein
MTPWQERIEIKLDQLMVDVAVLKERDRKRSAWWGGISGAAVAIIAALISRV